MQNGSPAWPAWQQYGRLLTFGTITFLGMVEYYLPAVLLGIAARSVESSSLEILAVVFWIIASVAVPGYMSHYCKQFDAMEVFNPIKALGRVSQGRRAYWHAWAIALAALLLSFLGLLALGVGFLMTSLWFWQVGGYSFANVFSKEFDLVEGA